MVTDDQARQAVRVLLEYIGEEPNREGLSDTPSRFIKAWRNDFFCGYDQDPREVLSTTFQEIDGYCQPVVMRDIKFYSYCEHHIVPIIGKAHIAYLPSNQVVGISKLARLVEVFARRLQVQERMTQQICDAIQEALNPRGAVVVVEGEHLCMSSRGVRTNTTLVTSSFSGAYRDNTHLALTTIKGIY